MRKIDNVPDRQKFKCQGRLPSADVTTLWWMFPEAGSSAHNTMSTTAMTVSIALLKDRSQMLVCTVHDSHFRILKTVFGLYFWVGSSVFVG